MELIFCILSLFGLLLIFTLLNSNNIETKKTLFITFVAIGFFIYLCLVTREPYSLDFSSILFLVSGSIIFIIHFI